MTGEEQARGSVRLLVDPSFGPFMVGKMLSTAGIWINNIAAAILVYDLTGSATLVGAVSIAMFAPQLFLTPLFGAMADRGDRRTQLIWGRLFVVAGSGLLGTWLLLVDVEGTSGAVAVIAAGLVVGIGFSLGGPAMQALVPSLIRPSELPAAVALSSAPFTLARAGGPAAGALIVTAAGPAIAFLIAAAANLAFAAIVALIRIRERDRDSATDSSIMAGLRHMRADRVVFALLVGTAAVGIGGDPAITLTPPIADELGGGAGLVGALASSFGIGAALAFPWIGWLGRHMGPSRVAPVGLTSMAVGLGVLAMAPVAPVAILGLGIAGVGFTLAVVSLSVEIQERTPEELRGRVMAMWMIAFVGSRPFAAGLNGVVADTVSTQAALALSVALLLGGAWIVRPGQPGDSRRSHGHVHSGPPVPP